MMVLGRILIAAAALGASALIAAHDLASQPCREWSRVPLQFLSDLLPGNEPFSNSWLYDLAHGASDRRTLLAYAMADPAAAQAVGNRGSSFWSDVQTGHFASIAPLQLGVLMPPPWLDRQEYVAEFERANPAARAAGDLSQLPGFVLIQLGGGAEGVQRQVLLLDDGRATVWARRRDYGNGLDALEVVREPAIRPSEASHLVVASHRLLAKGLATVHWSCTALDGAAVSILALNSGQLARGHWVNYRHPPPDAMRIVNRLLDLEKSL